MIHRNSTLNISRQAELHGFSRGMVYYTPKPISETDLALMHTIDKRHMAHPFMGARMLRNQCQRAGHQLHPHGKRLCLFNSSHRLGNT